MIGVIGGYGSVGKVACKAIKEVLNEKIQIGGRNIEKAHKLSDKERYFDSIKFVNTKDKNSLLEFIEGCDIIVNCTGPSHEISSKIANLAINNGCHYVDVGFDEEIKNMENIQNTCVIYGAGAIPGLSGILPYYLANYFDSVKELKQVYKSIGEFTKTSAEDFLEGIEKSNNLTSDLWKEKGIDSFTNLEHLNELSKIFDNKLEIYPYYDYESKRVYSQLQLVNGEWYMGIEGKHVSNFLKKARVEYKKNKEKAVAELCLASQLDVQASNEYIEFIIEMIGNKKEELVTKTLILKSISPTILSGLVIASTVIEITHNRMPKGIYALGAIRKNEQFIRTLTSFNTFIQLRIIERTMAEILSNEVVGEL